jgi:hypothetical protein
MIKPAYTALPKIPNLKLSIDKSDLISLLAAGIMPVSQFKNVVITNNTGNNLTI